MRKKTFFRSIGMLMFLVFMTIGKAYADSSEHVTIYVGETKKLILPTLIQNNAISVSYSINQSGYFRKVSSNRTSITIEGLKATSGDILITCSYQLKVTLEVGEHRFWVKVVDSNSNSDTGGNTPSSKDHVTIPDSLSMLIGESLSITAQTDAGMSVMWTWYYPKDGIISLSKSGRYYETATITALEAGGVTVSVSSNLGGWKSCYITIKDPSQQEEQATQLNLVDADGCENIPAKADVFYSRNLYKGWNSVCLPFALDRSLFGDGAMLAVYKGLTVVNGISHIEFTKVERVDAGMPCLVYVPTEKNFEFTGKDVVLSSEPLDASPCVGSFVRCVIGKGAYKLNMDGTAFSLTQSSEAICAPFRFYIQQ